MRDVVDAALTTMAVGLLAPVAVFMVPMLVALTFRDGDAIAKVAVVLVVSGVTAGIIGGVLWFVRTPSERRTYRPQPAEARRHRRAVIAIGSVAGSVLWPVGDPWSHPRAAGAAFLVGLAVALTLGALYPSAYLAVGASMVPVPAVIVAFTTDRGDGDGLWMMVFGLLATTGALLAIAARFASWVVRTRRA